MKISFITYGDITKHATLKRATGMAPSLAKLGIDVSILLEDNLENRKRVKLECPEVDIRYHQGGSSAKKERAQKVQTLKYLQPDVVWICGAGLRNWVLPSKEYPTVIGDHAELLSSIESRTTFRRGWDYLTEWAHLPSFSGHICASRYLEQLYRKRVQALRLDRPVHYSPYAYNPELLESAPTIIDDLNAQYGDKKNLLYMGSFWENYGFWDLLNVFENLLNERHDFRVLMMGKGPEKEAGIAWLEKKGLSDKIKILGYIPEEEISSYFQLADAFLCPLRDTIQDWARCPSKLFMYLPFNKPIITCPIGEALEIFGSEGFYYSPGSHPELKSAISRVLDLDGWTPTWNCSDHSWSKRSVDFLGWAEEYEIESR